MPAVPPWEQPVATSDQVDLLHNMKAKGGLNPANLDDLKKQIELAEFRGRHRRARDANGPGDVNGGGGRRRVSCKSKKGGKSASGKRCRRKGKRSRRARMLTR